MSERAIIRTESMCRKGEVCCLKPIKKTKREGLKVSAELIRYGL